MIEKERKFLVKSNKIFSKKEKATLIKQGYLLLGDKGRQLRVRIIDKKGFICYKYDVSKYEKEEYEYEIPYDEALDLYESAERKLEKYRCSEIYFSPINKNEKYNVDIDFYEKDLVILEIEYTNEFPEKLLDMFKHYDLIEVTGNRKYSNIRMAK